MTCETRSVEQISTSGDLYQCFDGKTLFLLNHLKINNQKIVVAHRGGIASGFPENSAASIRRTLQSVPVILEIDIMSTKDGVNILHHDKFLERTTTGRGKPQDFTWQEIQALKLKDESNRVTDLGILSFEQFLDEFAKEAFLMLDMKSPNSEKQIVEMLKERGILDGTIFIAYTLAQANRVKSAHSEAMIALGSDNIALLEKAIDGKIRPDRLVSLNGDINDISQQINLKGSPYHLLMGAYLGTNPLDAQLEISFELPIFEAIAASQLNMIVSNQAIRFHKALEAHHIAITSTESN